MVEKATEEVEVKTDDEQEQVKELTSEQATELQDKLAKTEVDLQTARDEAKAHQKAAFKAGEELRKSQASGERIDKIESTIGIQTQMLAEIMDSKDSEEFTEKPKVKPSERYLKTIEDQANTSKQTAKEKADQEWNELATEAKGLLRSINVEPDKFKEAVKEKPELFDAYIEFTSGNAKVGLEELRKVVSKMNKPLEAQKQETPEEAEIRIRADEKKKILTERGELDSETGLPSGGAGSDADFKKGIGDGSLPLNKMNMERARKLGLV